MAPHLSEMDEAELAFVERLLEEPDEPSPDIAMDDSGKAELPAGLPRAALAALHAVDATLSGLGVSGPPVTPGSTIEELLSERERAGCSA